MKKIEKGNEFVDAYNPMSYTNKHMTFQLIGQSSNLYDILMPIDDFSNIHFPYKIIDSTIYETRKVYLKKCYKGYFHKEDRKLKQFTYMLTKYEYIIEYKVRVIDVPLEFPPYEEQVRNVEVTETKLELVDKAFFSFLLFTLPIIFYHMWIQ